MNAPLAPATVLANLAQRAREIQAEHGHQFDAPAETLSAAAASFGGVHMRAVDAAIVRGLIRGCSYDATSYHAAIEPVLREGLAILEASDV